jgi:hypothetical protein
MCIQKVSLFALLAGQNWFVRDEWLKNDISGFNSKCFGLQVSRRGSILSYINSIQIFWRIISFLLIIK